MTVSKSEDKLINGYHSMTFLSLHSGLSLTQIREAVKCGKVPEKYIRRELTKSGKLKTVKLKHPEWALAINERSDPNINNQKLFSPALNKFIEADRARELEKETKEREKMQENFTQRMASKETIELKNLHLKNQKQIIELKERLGELVEFDKVKLEFRQQLTKLAQRLEDVPYKIAERGANKDYDDLLRIAQKEIDSLKLEFINYA